MYDAYHGLLCDSLGVVGMRAWKSRPVMTSLSIFCIVVGWFICIAGTYDSIDVSVFSPPFLVGFRLELTSLCLTVDRDKLPIWRNPSPIPVLRCQGLSMFPCIILGSGTRETVKDPFMFPSNGASMSCETFIDARPGGVPAFETSFAFPKPSPGYD